MTLPLDHFKHSVGVTAHQPDRIFVHNRSRADRHESVARIASANHFLPNLVCIILTSVQVERLRDPASDGVKVAGGVTPIEIVSTVQLKIRLLNELDPKLAAR